MLDCGNSEKSDRRMDFLFIDLAKSLVAEFTRSPMLPLCRGLSQPHVEPLSIHVGRLSCAN
jgi:hypothetical protein